MKMMFRNMLGSREARGNAFYNIISVIIAVIFLFPIYWLLMMSFKSDSEIFSPILTYFPHDFTLEPWLLNIQDKEFFMSLRNSCIIATMSMCSSMIIAFRLHMGWGGTKCPGKSHALGLLGFSDATTIFDANSMYLIFNKMGLLGTFGPQ